MSLTQKSVNDRCRRWECSQRRALNCNGKVVTDFENANVLEEKPHSHPSNPGVIEAAKLRQTFKDKAKDYRGRTGQLLIDGFSSSSRDCSMSLGKSSSVKRFVRRHVSEGRPKEPSTLQTFTVEDEYHLTTDREPGLESKSRIIMFATDSCLKLLSNAKLKVIYGWHF